MGSIYAHVSLSLFFMFCTLLYYSSTICSREEITKNKSSSARTCEQGCHEVERKNHHFDALMVNLVLAVEKKQYGICFVAQVFAKVMFHIFWFASLHVEGW